MPHTVQHTRSIPRENSTTILGEVKTSHPCLGRRSICLWELFGVCGLGLCCHRRDSQTFCAGLLVTDYQEKIPLAARAVAAGGFGGGDLGPALGTAGRLCLKAWSSL